MFNGQLQNDVVDGLVSLDERVAELERKETLTDGDGIGPFRWEVHVSQDGRGQFSSVKSACDFVAAQDNVGDVEWVIWIHAGTYEESAFTIPAFTTLEGLGGDVAINPSAEPLITSFITCPTFSATLRNLQISASVAPGAADVFLLDYTGSSLTLDGCRFNAIVSVSGGNLMGCVRYVSAVASGFDFFGCDFTISGPNGGAQYVLYIEVGEQQTAQYIRSCRIWRASTVSTSVAVSFAGTDAELYILETSILPLDVDIFADTGATVYLRATDYTTGDGAGDIVYIYGAPGTVSSIGLTAPAEIAVAGSPVTGSGTFALTWANQAANLVFAGPGSGAAATPTFRVLEVDDIPELPGSKITGGVVIGTGTNHSVAVWNDTDEIEDIAGFAFYNTDGAFFSTLGLPARLMVGGATDIVEILGTGSATNAELQIYYPFATASATGRALLSLVTNQIEPNDMPVGDVSWANAALESPTVDIRLGMIDVRTNGQTDRGYMSFWTGHDGTLAAAGRFTSVGNFELYNDLSVDGDVTIDGSTSAAGPVSISISAPSTYPFFFQADQPTGDGTAYAFEVNADGAAPRQSTFRSRGTAASKTTVTTGSPRLYTLDVQGHDGTSYVASSGILFEVGGTVGTGFIPGLIRFRAATAAGTVTDGFRLTSDLAVLIGRTSGLTGAGDLDVNGQLRVGSNLGLFGTTPTTKKTVTGSRGGNAALASLLTQLAAYGLITDSSSA